MLKNQLCCLFHNFSQDWFQVTGLYLKPYLLTFCYISLFAFFQTSWSFVLFKELFKIDVDGKHSSLKTTLWRYCPEIYAGLLLLKDLTLQVSFKHCPWLLFEWKINVIIIKWYDICTDLFSRYRREIYWLLLHFTALLTSSHVCLLINMKNCCDSFCS